jgi:hypothetical protein
MYAVRNAVGWLIQDSKVVLCMTYMHGFHGKLYVHVFHGKVYVVSYLHGISRHKYTGQTLTNG